MASSSDVSAPFPEYPQCDRFLSSLSSPPWPFPLMRGLPRRTSAPKQPRKPRRGRPRTTFFARTTATATPGSTKALKACGTTKCAAATRAALLRDMGALAFRNGQKGPGGEALRRRARAPARRDPEPQLRRAGSAVGVRGRDARRGGGGAAAGAAVSSDPGGRRLHAHPADAAANRHAAPDLRRRGDRRDQRRGPLQAGRLVLVEAAESEEDGRWLGRAHPLRRRPGRDAAVLRPGLQRREGPDGQQRRPFAALLCAIQDEISGDAPHLPGKDPPKKCHASSDCPPDFPGCAKNDGATGDSEDRR